jgi:hypothetical protein
VHHDAADRPVFHLGERFEHECGHEENVRDPVALHHLGEQRGTCHSGHGDLIPPVRRRMRPARLITEAYFGRLHHASLELSTICYNQSI